MKDLYLCQVQWGSLIFLQLLVIYQQPKQNAIIVKLLISQNIKKEFLHKSFKSHKKTERNGIIHCHCVILKIWRSSIALLPHFAGWPVTMTTEAGSETEVKEKAEESAAQPDRSEKAKEETQEVPNAEGEEKEKEKEKEGKEGKGIARYLPTWLKKQKSQSQVQFIL